MRKLVEKHRFWSYKVWKLEEVSHETLVLRLQHVSSRFSGFLLASPCLWGKRQNLSFSNVLRGRHGTSWSSWDCHVSANVSKVALCTGAILLCRFQTTSCTFRGRRSTGDLHRHFAWQAQHFRRVALRVFCECHCQCCVKWRQCAKSVACVACCDMWWHSTLRTLHFTLHTPHFTLYTLHSTLYTPHSTLHTPHFTLHPLHSTLYTLHLTLCCRIALVLGCLHLEKRRNIAKKWTWKMQIWKRHTWQLQKNEKAKCKLKRGKNCK